MSVPVRPASTVVLLRDGAEDLEVLMVRRNRALAFAGGFWVFPGGAVDEADRAQAGDDPDEAARYAAAREAQEEAGVSPDPQALVLISHWTTPVGEGKRFSTWIFAGEVEPDAEIVIDGSEIHDFRWVGVGQALAQHKAGELPVMPPTFITLCAVARYATAAEALAGERETPCPRVLPLLVPTNNKKEFVTLYPGDVAYDSGDVNAEGPRHRAFMSNASWQYQYEGVSEPPLYPQD